MKESAVYQPHEKQEIYDEILKSKDDIIEVIESVRKEIYDNLDEILQSHVNALEEKKLLLLKENDSDDFNGKSKIISMFNSFAKEIRVKINLIEESLTYKVDYNLFETKINNIIVPMLSLN